MQSLKLLAEQLLLGSSAGGSLIRSLQSVNRIRVYVPGELPLQRLVLPARLVVFASPDNPGAVAVAQDLAEGMGGAIDVTFDPAAIEPAQDGRGAEATHLLLYLNSQTFLGEQGERLAEQLRAVRVETSTVQVVMAHECDAARGGCVSLSL